MSRRGSKLLRINENLPVIFVMSPSIVLVYMFSLDTINGMVTLPIVDVDYSVVEEEATQRGKFFSFFNSWEKAGG